MAPLPCHSERNQPSALSAVEGEAISLHHSLFLVRHSIFTTTFAFLLLLFLIAAPAYAKYGGGTGEPNDPYLIFDANQMNAIGADSNDWDKHFLLCADIDLSGFTGESFNIIGYWLSYSDKKPFTGVVDGNGHTISNFTYSSTGTRIGLFGYVRGETKNLGLITPHVQGRYRVGSLVGRLSVGTIANCYVKAGSITGDRVVGGLIGSTGSTTQISNCHATGNILGQYDIGGLIGYNGGIVSKCHSAVSVIGNAHIGGLVGYNSGSISKCYSTGSISATSYVGGLVGKSYYGTITNCYATGSVSGNSSVGGLVGYNFEGDVTNSFWDTQTSGQSTSDGGTGLPTAEMQMQVTFTDAGWDFATPVWTIDDGVDYPRLWWEFVPVLHPEPEVTLGTSNTISWEPVIGDVEYYAECAEDENFTSIVYNSGWITETSCEFTGLELGKRYWYSVKARNAAGIETAWSNVESSLQVTLADAVEIELTPESLKNENMKNALLNKIDEVLEMIADGLYADALKKLRNDILAKMNGCGQTGEPDKNDWIITCEEQSQLCPLVTETIEHVKGLMNQ